MRAPPSARLSLCGSQGSSDHVLRSFPRKRESRLWVPAFAGTNGMCRSVPLHDALAAGRLQARAEFARLALGLERNLGPVIGTLVTQIGTPDHRLATTQHRRELLLQRPVRGLRIGFAPLRGHLHPI